MNINKYINDEAFFENFIFYLSNNTKLKLCEKEIELKREFIEVKIKSIFDIELEKEKIFKIQTSELLELKEEKKAEEDMDVYIKGFAINWTDNILKEIREEEIRKIKSAIERCNRYLIIHKNYKNDADYQYLVTVGNYKKDKTSEKRFLDDIKSLQLGIFENYEFIERYTILKKMEESKLRALRDYDEILDREYSFI